MIFTFNGRPKQLRTFGGFPDISISKVIQLKRDNAPTGILGMQIDYDDDTKLYNLCFAVKESVFDEYEVIAEVTLKKCDDKIATDMLLKQAEFTANERDYDDIDVGGKDLIIADMTEALLYSTLDSFVEGRFENGVYCYRLHRVNEKKYCDYGVMLGSDEEIIDTVRDNTENFKESKMLVVDLFDPFFVASCLNVDVQKALNEDSASEKF